MNRLSLVSSVLIILLVVATGLFYYLNFDSPSNHYSNGNISFNYPNKYNLDSHTAGTENMSGYFVTAIDAPDNSSSIVIYQIPVASNLTIPTNMLTTKQSSSLSNQVNISMMKDITVNEINNTNSTTTLIMSNVQFFLNKLQSRNGNFTNITKNDYIYYSTSVLNSSYANYSNGSRVVSTQPLTIKDTFIVKGGYPNFYVIEYLSSDNSTISFNAYSMVINTFNIGG